MSVLPPPSLADVQPSREVDRAGRAPFWLALSYVLGPATVVGLAALSADLWTPAPGGYLVALSAWLVLTAVLMAGLLRGLHRRPLARHLSILLVAGLAGVAVVVGGGVAGGVPGSPPW